MDMQAMLYAILTVVFFIFVAIICAPPVVKLIWRALTWDKVQVCCVARIDVPGRTCRYLTFWRIEHPFADAWGISDIPFGNSAQEKYAGKVFADTTYWSFYNQEKIGDFRVAYVNPSTEPISSEPVIKQYSLGPFVFSFSPYVSNDTIQLPTWKREVRYKSVLLLAAFLLAVLSCWECLYETIGLS